MINANELRIGNYLNFMEDNTVFMVNEIAETGISCSNEKETTWIELDQFSGIPLTIEILEKCGFKKSESNTMYLGRFGIYLSNTMNTFSYKSCVWSGDELKSLHQLQNLYFALTGEELNITL